MGQRAGKNVSRKQKKMFIKNGLDDKILLNRLMSERGEMPSANTEKNTPIRQMFTADNENV